MKRNPSRTKGLTDELAELRGLDSTALKQRWRVLYRTEAPAHIGRALLLQAVAHRLQERALGGVKSSTAACSSGPPKTTSTGDHQPRRPHLGSRRAAY